MNAFQNYINNAGHASYALTFKGVGYDRVFAQPPRPKVDLVLSSINSDFHHKRRLNK